MFDRIVVAAMSIAILSAVGGCASIGQKSSSDVVAQLGTPPEPPREFRAVWVATVANIDWPSKPGLTTEQQKAEAIAILDRCAILNINAVVFQVRPGCDALYDSQLEPWSYYLTGEQGRRPEPYYDPLEFWINAAHKRGIELHAWFNPYRARHSGAKDKSQADNHISKSNPNIVKEFNGWQWLDPAEQAAQDLTYNVFMDVVKRYDVDGIHIDDYFYPYPDYYTVDGKKGEFPDDASWQRHQESGGTMSRDDWRRHNVDVLIERIYRGTKKIKKHVQFGISPFGQPNKRYAPPGVDVKFSQYDILFADAEKWLDNGWLDYWTPQLYWPIAQQGQAFPDLVDYWKTKNTQQRHFWPGLYTSRFIPRRENATAPATATTQTAASPTEIVDQISLAREKRVDGHVHFSMKPIMTNDRLAAQLAEIYPEPALVPATLWLDSKPPRRPSVAVKNRNEGMASIALRPAWGERPTQWVLYTKYGNTWNYQFYAGKVKALDVPQVKRNQKLVGVALIAVDRSENLSEPAFALPK
jgi:uncharacterized lipoprotein YddW (UPF0748 family)